MKPVHDRYFCKRSALGLGLCFGLLACADKPPSLDGAAEAQEGTSFADASARRLAAYRFPIVPGTPAWAALSTHDEMLAATQVPKEILAGMSTSALVTTALSYPLRWDMSAFNTAQEGLDQLIAGFNGLQELLRRADAGTALLRRYQAVDPAAIPSDWSLVQQGEYDAHIRFLEALLAHPTVLATLSPAEQKVLLHEGLRKAEGKERRAEVYGGLGQDSSAWMVARTLNAIPGASGRMDPGDSRLQAFLNDGVFGDEALAREVLQKARIAADELQ